jgi:gliding motility-associated-like protein
MKKTLYIILFIFSVESYGQAFLNGSFENNTAIDDETNLLNIDYNSYMSNSIGFGYLPALNLAGNLDILTSSSYCGGAQNGNWYVGLTSGGSDAFSLELSSPLIIGNSYSMSFYDRSCSPGQGEAIQIGVSETNNNFENLVYSAPTPINNVGWTLRTFTFIAPIDGLFITVKCNGIDTHEGFWTNVDNFSIDCSINLNLGGDTTLCQGESLTLDATTTNATYIWKGDSTRSTLNVTEQGDYWVKVTLGNCSISDTINVNFISKPTIDLGNDTTVCLGESVILNATTPNATYLWQNNSTNPTLNIILQGTYWVEAKNNCGIDSDTINVDLESCICILYIPNSFTPNFDNTNDQFSPLFDCDITEYSFLIFNRFGELIFETNTQNSSWHGDFNGELCPTGIYIYLIKYKYEGSYQKKYGHVGLLK